jgi:hypothetical protein
MSTILEEISSNCSDLVLLLGQSCQDICQIRYVVRYTRETIEFLYEMRVNMAGSRGRGGMVLHELWFSELDFECRLSPVLSAEFPANLRAEGSKLPSRTDLDAYKLENVKVNAPEERKIEELGGGQFLSAPNYECVRSVYRCLSPVGISYLTDLCHTLILY